MTEKSIIIRVFTVEPADDITPVIIKINGCV
jgi:hypothetical protein